MILGHQRQIDYFNTVLARGRLAHAYVFYGPEHIGKFTFATRIAECLFCPSLRDPGGGGLENIFEMVCGTCTDCLRIKTRLHPHVLFIDPEHLQHSEKDSKKEISIDEVREMKRILSFAPEGDRSRVFIINHADRLSPEAADALLKLLEEPGEQTLFMLITAHPDFLTTTIRSRSCGIRFSTLSDKILSAFLTSRHVPEGKRLEFLSLANGRPGMLLELLDHPPVLEAEKRLIRYLITFKKRSYLYELLRLSPSFVSDRREREQVVEYALRMVRKEILNNSSGAGVAGLVKKVKNIIRYKEMLETSNVNPKLAMDMILLEFAG